MYQPKTLTQNLIVRQGHDVDHKTRVNQQELETQRWEVCQNFKVTQVRLSHQLLTIIQKQEVYHWELFNTIVII